MVERTSKYVKKDKRHRDDHCEVCGKPVPHLDVAFSNDPDHPRCEVHKGLYVLPRSASIELEKVVKVAIKEAIAFSTEDAQSNDKIKIEGELSKVENEIETLIENLNNLKNDASYLDAIAKSLGLYIGSKPAITLTNEAVGVLNAIRTKYINPINEHINSGKMHVDQYPKKPFVPYYPQKPKLDKKPKVKPTKERVRPLEWK